MYMSIQTTWNKTINLSGKHLIYAKRNLTDKFQPVYVCKLKNFLTALKYDEIYPN